jgi:hypothetical protein
MIDVRRFLLVAALAVSPGPGLSWAQGPDKTATPQAPGHQSERHTRPAREAVETKTLTLERDAVLSIFNMAGDTEITAASGADPTKLTITRRGFGHTDEEAQAVLMASSLDIRQHAGRVEVRTMPVKSSRRAPMVLSITAPASLAVDARSMAGDIVLAGVTGDARLETVSGDIVGRDLARLASAKTMSGDVMLTNCTSKADLSAATVSGDVAATGIRAPSCEFGSISGDVSLKEFACDRAGVRSVSGDVGYSGTLARGGRYEFKSHSGDVRVALDGKTGFDLEARTHSGSLRTDLPLTTRATPGEEGGASRRLLSGVFGDGSAEIAVTTFSGDVTITRK